MKKIKFYEYAPCSTCKKALKFLDRKKCEYEKISIVESPPTDVELKKMLGFLGGDIKKLFNTSGIMYREMELSKKLPSLSQAEAIRLLAKNGKLIKRPFLLLEGDGTVGFQESEWDKLISR